MSYGIWVPLIILVYIIQAWLTVQNNILKGNWWIYLYIFSMISPWVLVSRMSKNIIFDAFLYDSVLIVSYSIGILYFTDSLGKLSNIQFVGTLMILVGLILFKKGI